MFNPLSLNCAGLSAPRHRNAIASDFLNRRRNDFKSQGVSAVRSKFGHFSSQNASQPQPYRYHEKIASWHLDKLVGTTCSYSMWVALQSKPSKNRCVQFRPRKRIADFDRKSWPGDGALRCWFVSLFIVC